VTITSARSTSLRLLAGELERSHPGAAASLREGMAETLTVTRLGVKGSLKRTLQSTNLSPSSATSTVTKPRRCCARSHERIHHRTAAQKSTTRGTSSLLAIDLPKRFVRARWHQQLETSLSYDLLARVLLREERVDLLRQVRDLLGQLLVLQRELGVRLE
jgi:hypothetical protein